MRVLVIEDDKETREFLELGLKEEGFDGHSASDGIEGSTKAQADNFDIILLDYMLPKMNGLNVCREIRKQAVKTPVLMLSVQNEIPHKVQVLNAGADDYMTKPFAFLELIARIKALVRRPFIYSGEVMQVGDINLDASKQEVRVGKQKKYLTRKEYNLLEYFMKHVDHVVERSRILEEVWGEDYDPFSNTLEAHIANLRRKIESKQRKFIFAIPGRGYIFDPWR